MENVRKMLKNLLSSLEERNHPLLGPTLWGLQSWGMWQPNSRLNIVYNTIHLAGILFVLSQYVELWLLRHELESALHNLSITMLTSVCVVKASTFVIWQKHWRDVIYFVSDLEKSQLEKRDKMTHAIIGDYVKYSRRVTYFYWSLVAATVITVVVSPLGVYISSSERELMRNGTISYPVIMSAWVPFDRTRGVGYWVVTLEHSVLCLYGGGIVASYDTNAVALMSFFCGQLELLVENCKRLFGEDQVSGYAEAMERIRECHLHHLSLIKYSKKLNSLMSPVMFFYVFICSLMICANALLLTNENTTTMQCISVAEYLAAIIAQLFLYCWHGNKVFIMSVRVDRGVYESQWWRCGVRLRRCALLLAGQLRKTILFTAGPFANLTVATFIAILKGSYSYYTLLSNNED